ncbi:MAG: hypothetical protein ACOZNI_09435 [Myxococcota bacterium]
MLWMLVACPRPVAPALEVEPEVEAAEAPEPADPEARAAWMVASDPLVRRPRVPEGAVPADLADAVARLKDPQPPPQVWWQLEARNRGTRAVPFARGARLAVLETALGDPAEALAWVVPLPPPPGVPPDEVRPPLAWLGTERAEDLLVVVERQVMLGWLDGPGVDAKPAAAALAADTYDRLAATPSGKLLLARGKAPVDAAAGADGLAKLEEATWLAAMDVAADRDVEQARFKELEAEVAARVGAAPLKALLDGAEAAYLKDAGTDASVGGALLAQAARRWIGACPDTPCGGLDRVAEMGTAARWGVGGLAEAWQVVALKGAADRLEFGYEHATGADAMVGVVEALVGTGATGIDRSILRRLRPDLSVNLTLTRAAGGGDLTSKEDLVRALRARVAERARAAASSAPAKLKEPLERIAKRAS